METPEQYPGPTSEGLAEQVHQDRRLVPRPSLDRIVLYTFPKNANESDRGQSDTVPAIIVCVHSDTCVNLRVFQDGNYGPTWITSVVQRDASNEEHGNYWEWPARS